MPLFLPTNITFHWEAVASRDGFGAPTYSTSGTYLKGFLTEDRDYSRQPKNETNRRRMVLITGEDFSISAGDKIMISGVKYDAESVQVRRDINGNFFHVEHTLLERD